MKPPFNTKARRDDATCAGDTGPKTKKRAEQMRKPPFKKATLTYISNLTGAPITVDVVKSSFNTHHTANGLVLYISEKRTVHLIGGYNYFHMGEWSTRESWHEHPNKPQLGRVS